MNVVGAKGAVVDVVDDAVILLDDVETALDDDDEVGEVVDVVLVVNGADELTELTEDEVEEIELGVAVVVTVELVFAESATYPPTARIIITTTTTTTIKALETACFRFFILVRSTGRISRV